MKGHIYLQVDATVLPFRLGERCCRLRLGFRQPRAEVRVDAAGGRLATARLQPSDCLLDSSRDVGFTEQKLPQTVHRAKLQQTRQLVLDMALYAGSTDTNTTMAGCAVDFGSCVFDGEAQPWIVEAHISFRAIEHIHGTAAAQNS